MFAYLEGSGVGHELEETRNTCHCHYCVQYTGIIFRVTKIGCAST